ncbi:MAG TPA: nitroreductase, partial [Verrucomicrobiae bacterium]|nr:nitroreductase [Verrucomicrobiae bacterium]
GNMNAVAGQSMGESAENFPVQAGPDEKLLFLLNFAVRAPSSHNTQPWLFRIQGHEVDLMADLKGSLPLVDPLNRELIISCGAALHHLRVAARYFGYSSRVEPFPEADNPDLLARFSLGAPCEADTTHILLGNAIAKRSTNRFPFLAEPIPETLLDVLTQTAEHEGAWLHAFADEESRFQIADTVADADRVQWGDRQFRRELAAWLTPNTTRRRDGIPGYAHGIGNLASEAEAFVVRTFDLGQGRAARDRDIALHSPVLAVLGTEGDSREDWLNAGQALSAILLRARVEDVSASFLNQAVEVPFARARLEALTGTKGAPQILLRLGFGREVKSTPRRPVHEVLLQPKNRPIRLTVENLS